jgi:dTDP-4-dehydrorhamnose 3,5-epimerase
MIEGVQTKSLKLIPDERGWLMEMLRNDDPVFVKFGQLYATATYPGVVKGWHLHREQVDNFVCVAGMVKLVLYDPREDSPTRKEINEFFIGDRNALLVQVPAGVYHGWKCISPETSIVVNCPTELYHYAKPDEVRLDAHTKEIPYDWARVDR